MYYQQTPIYSSTKLLLQYIIVKTFKMKSEWKYTVARDIRDMVYNLFRDIQYANRQTDRVQKIRWLEKFQADFGIVEVQINILYEEGIWNDKTRSELSEILVSIAKQVTAWRKKT